MAQAKQPQTSNKNLIGNIIAFSAFFIVVFLVVMMLTGDSTQSFFLGSMT